MVVAEVVGDFGRDAVSMLQGLFRKMGLDVLVDGILGPQTARAAERALRMAPDHLIDAYCIELRNHAYRIARNDRGFRTHVDQDGAKGAWILRAEASMSERFHLSISSHRERVRAWR